MRPAGQYIYSRPYYTSALNSYCRAVQTQFAMPEKKRTQVILFYFFFFFNAKCYTWELWWYIWKMDVFGYQLIDQLNINSLDGCYYIPTDATRSKRACRDDVCTLFTTWWHTYIYTGAESIPGTRSFRFDSSSIAHCIFFFSLHPTWLWRDTVTSVTQDDDGQMCSAIDTIQISRIYIYNNTAADLVHIFALLRQPPTSPMFLFIQI